MSEANPYQSPEADPLAVDPGSFTPGDRKVAARLLVVHERGRYSIVNYFISALPRSVGPLIILFGFSLIAIQTPRGISFPFLFGLAMGMAIIEMQHALLTVRGWPTLRKFIDWRRVEAVAAGRSPES